MDESIRLKKLCAAKDAQIEALYGRVEILTDDIAVLRGERAYLHEAAQSSKRECHTYEMRARRFEQDARAAALRADEAERALIASECSFAKDLDALRTLLRTSDDAQQQAANTDVETVSLISQIETLRAELRALDEASPYTARLAAAEASAATAAAPMAAITAVSPPAATDTPAKVLPTVPRLPPMPWKARVATSEAPARRCSPGEAASEATSTRRSAASPAVPNCSSSRRARSAPSVETRMPTEGRLPDIDHASSGTGVAYSLRSTFHRGGGIRTGFVLALVFLSGCATAALQPHPTQSPFAPQAIRRVIELDLAASDSSPNLNG
jgi:hypothetical protein